MRQVEADYKCRKAALSKSKEGNIGSKHYLDCFPLWKRHGEVEHMSAKGNSLYYIEQAERFCIPLVVLCVDPTYLPTHKSHCF